MTPEQDRPSMPERDSLVSLSPQQIVEVNAKFLTDDLNNAQKGSAAASVDALQEVHEMQRGGYLNKMTQDLEKNGAKVVCGPNGEIDHIIFPGTGGKPDIDIDVQKDTVNGKSSDQVKAAAATQAKEFVASALADPNITDATGKPLSPEAQAQANKLVAAMLDGDVKALTAAAKEIMKDPETAKAIGQVLDRVAMPSGVQFKGMDSDNPYMTLSNGGSNGIVVPKFGPPRANRMDAFHGITGATADLNETMKDFQSQALWSYSENIESAQRYLNMYKKMPADGYTNMKSLEGAYNQN